MKKKVAIVTRIKFWLSGAGVYSRSAQLIRYLSEHVDITVFFLGIQEMGDTPKIRQFVSLRNFVWLQPNLIITDQEYSSILENYFKIKSFDCCIFSRWDCAIFHSVISGNTKKILDVDDIPSETLAGKKEIDSHSLKLIEKTEQLTFQKFDYLLAIQQEHVAKFNRDLPESTVILASHALAFTPKLIRHEVKNIGYIASHWETNIDALNWFLNNVWKELNNKEISLNVYGGVGVSFNKRTIQGIKIHMFTPNIEDAYEHNDIIINPVRYGSGLKIKTVEALANGLPLVTTSEGARGLNGLNNKALLIADTPDVFLNRINKLIESYELRKSIGRGAYDYATSNFTPEICYKPLLETILNA